MSIFIPAYLYIKQHSVTGKLYFGRTIAKDPEKYKGSGKLWLRHIKKHGKEHVVTLWYCLFLDEASIREFAEIFSYQHNIVESKDWANLIPESGMNDRTGAKHTAETKLKIKEKRKSQVMSPRTDEQKLNNRLAALGNTWSVGGTYWQGKTMTKESSDKKSAALLGKDFTNEHLDSLKKASAIKIKCEYCHRDFDRGNYARSHGDRCKLKHNQRNATI